MKILFVGVLDVRWSTNLEMKRALEQLGHDVDDFNYRSVAAQYRHRIDRLKLFPIDKLASALHRVRWLPGMISNWYWRRAGRDKMRNLLMERVKAGVYDLVLFAKTDTLHCNAISDIGRYCPTWFYFMDPAETSSKVVAREFARRATWSSATSSVVAEEFIANGANAFHMIQGVDVDRFHYSRPSKGRTIVFAGTKTPDREQWIGSLNSAGFTVTCFGSGWDAGPKFSDELVQEYQHAAIVLNFCRDATIFSVRVVQAMACGAFVLTQMCDDLAKYFLRNEHLDWFETAAEMEERVAYFLDHEAERKKIAESGSRLAHDKFGWIERMSDLTSVVEAGIVRQAQTDQSTSSTN